MKWLKLYTLEWLEGSIRVDLTAAERSVWADLLAMAGMCRNEGHIERSQGIPYTREELATRFAVSLELVNSTIDKCVKEGRIELNGDGTLTIVNWSKYQSIPAGKEKPAPETARERELRERRNLRRLQTTYPDEATQTAKVVVNSKTGEVLSRTLEFDGEKKPSEAQCKKDLERITKEGTK